MEEEGEGQTHCTISISTKQKEAEKKIDTGVAKMEGREGTIVREKRVVGVEVDVISVTIQKTTRSNEDDRRVEVDLEQSQ